MTLHPGKATLCLEEFLVIFMINHVVLLFLFQVDEKFGVDFLFRYYINCSFRTSTQVVMSFI